MDVTKLMELITSKLKLDPTWATQSLQLGFWGSGLCRALRLLAFAKRFRSAAGLGDVGVAQGVRSCSRSSLHPWNFLV